MGREHSIELNINKISLWILSQYVTSTNQRYYFLNNTNALSWYIDAIISIDFTLVR